MQSHRVAAEESTDHLTQTHIVLGKEMKVEEQVAWAETWAANLDTAEIIGPITIHDLLNTHRQGPFTPQERECGGQH